MITAAEVDGLPREMWPAEFACRDVRSMGNRGEAAGMKALDAGASLSTERIELGCSNGPSSPIFQVVVPKGIGDQEDDVFHNACVYRSTIIHARKR